MSLAYADQLLTKGGGVSAQMLNAALHYIILINYFNSVIIILLIIN